MPVDAITSEMLEHVGDVPMSYVHRDRKVEPRVPLIVPGGILKWYNVYDRASPVPLGLEERSRATVLDFLEMGVADLHYGLGVVVLHHSTANDFLLVGSWRGHQEYWQSIFIRDADTDNPWIPIEQGAISPVFCVWEMAPIWHERNAWVRYLKSGRTVDDRRAFLEDQLMAEM